MGAIQFLDGWLTNDDTICEYGSGFSTAWFAERAHRIVSVESSPRWFSIVGKETASCTNVALHLVDSKENLTPIATVSWDYVRFITRFEAESFDLILNDGYARPLVANQAIDLKKGGVLIWDDWAGSYPVAGSRTPRALRSGDAISPLVKQFLEATADWRTVVFDDGTHTSALFFKPARGGPGR